VPSIRGRTVRAARSLLDAGNCRLGRIQRAFSSRVRRGRIISQSLLAGREARDWAFVGVVASKGARR
jgi:beta-lactam-binding protein with PASTA domain